MKFGITIPNNWGVEDPQQVLDMGPRAEELGFDSLWVMDHLFNVAHVRSRIYDKPYYHPMSVLSYLAATTKRAMLGTSVLVLPYHNPVELAKYAATLDQISGGRLTLGVGAGATTEEFELLGIPLRSRGTLTDESIAIMKELWTSARPSFKSSRWNIEETIFTPKPKQTPHIPFWIGGSSPAALRRAARDGDGWHPSGISPEDFSLGAREIREQAAAAGRDPASLTMSVRVDVNPSSDLGQLAATLAAYQTSGVEHVVLAIGTGDTLVINNLADRMANEVIPQVR